MKGRLVDDQTAQHGLPVISNVEGKTVEPPLPVAARVPLEPYLVLLPLQMWPPLPLDYGSK